MASASTKEVFNCSKEQFFKIVSDYEKYSEFLPEVKSIKIYKAEGSVKEMEYHVSLVKTFKYKLKVKETGTDKIEFNFISGDVFKKMSGSWVLSEQNGKCAIEYNVEASFGMLVPEAMAKPLVSANLPMMMSNFKKRVSQIYGQ